MMTPTYYREYKQLNRISGMSLHDGALICRVLPEREESLMPTPKRRFFSWPGFLTLLGLWAVIGWMAYEAFK